MHYEKRSDPFQGLGVQNSRLHGFAEEAGAWGGSQVEAGLLYPHAVRLGNFGLSRPHFPQLLHRQV